MFDLALGALVSTTTGFVNYTPEVTDGTKYEYADLSSLATTQYFYLGYAFKTFGSTWTSFQERKIAGHPAIQPFRPGTGQRALDKRRDRDDGTRNGNYSLNHTGLIQWDGNSVTETKRTLGGILTPLYWYRIIGVKPFHLRYMLGRSGNPLSLNPSRQCHSTIRDRTLRRAMYGPGNVNKHGLDFSYPNLPHVMTGPLAGSTGNIFGPGCERRSAALHERRGKHKEPL